MKKKSMINVVAMAMVVLILASLSVGPVSAFQGSTNMQWTPPTTFVPVPPATVGAPLNPATDLQGFNVYCGTVSGGPYPTKTFVPGGTATGLPNYPLNPGTTFCVVTALTTTANGSLESGYSNEASKTVTAPASTGCTGFKMP